MIKTLPITIVYYELHKEILFLSEYCCYNNVVTTTIMLLTIIVIMLQLYGYYKTICVTTVVLEFEQRYYENYNSITKIMLLEQYLYSK